MKVSVSIEGQSEIHLDLHEEVPIETVKQILEGETFIAAGQQAIAHRGKVLTDEQTLGDAAVGEGDVVLLTRKGKSQSEASNQGIRREDRSQSQQTTFNRDGTATNPSELIQQLRENKELLGQLRQQNPRLAAAVEAGDASGVQAELKRATEERAKQEAEYQQLVKRVNLDPLDVEAQKEIERMIHERNISENLECAMENMPESFTRVTMLYINLTVNHVPFKAFVDTGAQMTIMSQTAAERAGLSNLIDRRWQGVAKGVGTQNIVGRIHQAPISIGGSFLPCSITVLEQEQSIELIFGLDMLMRHQCSIDLGRSRLYVGTTGAEVPFLGEADIPQGSLGTESDEQQGGSSAHGQDPASAFHHQSQGTASTSDPSTGEEPDPEKVEQLVHLGFDKASAGKALVATKGNIDMAASLLFERGQL